MNTQLRKLRGAMKGLHLGLVLAMLAALVFAHYSDLLGIGAAAPTSAFGLGRHTIERILFLVPILYGCFVFGFWRGITLTAVSLLAMLPRAVLQSDVRGEAIMESFAVAIAASIACLWIGALDKEKQWYQDALSELQESHAQLQHYVNVARENEQKLTTLNAISAVLAQTSDLKETLGTVVNMVVEVMRADFALVHSLQGDGEEMKLVGHQGVSPERVVELQQVKVGQGFLGRVAQTGEPISIKGAAPDPREPDLGPVKAKAESRLIVPLSLGERIVGTLCVGTRRPRDFTAAEADLLTSVGNQIGVAIDNARLAEQQRLAAQQAIANQRRYQELFENAIDAIWVHDLEGNIITANKGLEKLTGYSVAELTHMNVKAFLSKESLDLAGDVRRRVFEGEPLEQPYTQRIFRRDGTEAILDLTTNLVTESGRRAAFQCIARDVTREKQLQDDLRFYLGQITRAQEEERKRIARELHDDTAQVVYGFSRQLDNFVRHNKKLSSEDAAFLSNLRGQLDGALLGIRRFSQDLRPPMLDDLGLLPALRWLIGETREQYGLHAELEVKGLGSLGTRQRFDADQEMVVFRIVQEALRNVARHAQASKAQVTLEFGPDKTRVSITDDGKGFEVPARVTDLPRDGKLGLAGIEERVRLLGGVLNLKSAPGKGTSVEVEMPA